MRKRYEMQGAETDPMEDYKQQELNKRRDSIHSLSFIFGLVFIFTLGCLYGLVFFIDTILPTPLKIGDEGTNREAFITERAQNDLKTLTSLGPRIVGTYENEALAVDFLKRELAIIQDFAHKNQKIEVDVQTVSGAYYLAFTPFGVINSYGNVQNVVVKLHSKNNSKHGVLINAHFDTVPTSPGGSDDGINCVVMLEVLRKLASLSERLEHNVIFLFNGAEESPLQASHGFITKHKWASEVSAFINLEAAGAGGKEILFQAGPSRPWLLKYYTKVPYPSGQVAAEEVFKSGIIPSDTDFRVFRDFGNLVGTDMAFARNGYRYHTKFDGFTNIPAGTYQHVGSNVLTLVRNLANAPELSDPLGQPSEDMVFFDFFGLFLIIYTKTVAIIVHSVVSLVSLIITFKSLYDFRLVSSWKSLVYILLAFGTLLLGWILSAVFMIVFAYLLDAMNVTMRWYKISWIIFGTYVAPFVLYCCGTLFLLNKFYNKDNLSISGHTQIQLHLVRLIWMILLLIGTFVGVRSVYTIFVSFLFQTLAFAIIQIFRLQFSIRKWQIVYIISMIIPTMFLMNLILQIASTLVPICGRSGIEKNPEFIIGAISLISTWLITSPFIPLITLIRKPQILLLMFGVIFLASFVVIFTPLGFPYTGNVNSPAPQRFYTFHTSRVFRDDANDIYKKDSGIFILPVDRNGLSTVNYHLSNFSTRPLLDDCEKALFCGLPLASYKTTDALKHTAWIPSGQPIVHETLDLKLISKAVVGPITRFTFKSSGPTHTAIYLSPREGIVMTNISLIPQLPTQVMVLNNRLTYVIVHTWGKENTPLDFYVDFTIPTNWNAPIFDIALSGKYMNNKTNVNTPHYMSVLNQFPDFAAVAPALAAYESWVY